tara:strand:+ start:62 stop:280 length:219 start_codon:yes stop_codon:yes gene_type:complete
MIISTMTIMELSIAVVGMLGAVGGVIKASNCKKVSVCRIIECEKVVELPTNDFDRALNKDVGNVKDGREDKG